MCTSCDDATAPDPASVLVQGVVIRASTDSLFYGGSMQFVAVAVGDSATVRAPLFTWTSSDPEVAIVDSAGIVHGLSTGQSRITASFAGRRAEFVVRVVLYPVGGGVSFASMAHGIGAPMCALSADGWPYCEADGSDFPSTFAPLRPITGPLTKSPSLKSIVFR
jgi:hypothetical protein